MNSFRILVFVATYLINVATIVATYLINVPPGGLIQIICFTQIILFPPNKVFLILTSFL